MYLLFKSLRLVVFFLYIYIYLYIYISQQGCVKLLKNDKTTNILIHLRHSVYQIILNFFNAFQVS